MSTRSGDAVSSAVVEPAPTRARSRVSWLMGARLNHWAHFLFLPLAGYDPTANSRVNALALGRGVVIAFSALAFGYLLNGVSDRYMDGSAEKNPLVDDNQASSHTTILVVLAAISILASLLGPWPVTIATLVVILSGIVYSIGPRWKRLPIVGTLLNVTNFAPLLWVGSSTIQMAPNLWILTICFSVLLLQNQVLHEAADREDDHRGQILTTFRLLGARLSAGLLCVLGALLAFVASRIPSMTQLAWPLGLAYAAVFPGILYFWGDGARAMKQARLAHRFACLIAGALIFFVDRFKY